MTEHQTVSRVLMSGGVAEPERVLLRRWCEEAAANGGSFAITQEWAEQQWFSTYVINWPAGVAPTPVDTFRTETPPNPRNTQE